MATAAVLNSFWVVLFEDGLSVIPDTWMLPGKKASLFPNTKQRDKIEKAVKTRSDPKENWKIWKVLRTFGQYEKYDDAVRKSKTAEVSSDLNSDDERNHALLNQDQHSPQVTHKGRAKKAKNQSQAHGQIREHSSSSSSSSPDDSGSGSSSSEPELEVTILDRNGRRKGGPANRPGGLTDTVKVTSKQPDVRPNVIGKRVEEPNARPTDAAAKGNSKPQGSLNDRANGNPKSSIPLDGTAEGDPQSNNCYCGNPKQFEERFKRLEYDIRLIKKHLRSILEKLDELPNAMAQSTNRIVEISELTTLDEAFPLKSEEEVEQLNIMLTEDPQKAEYLEKFFKTVGGTGHVEAIRRCLVRTFTDNVATAYSWDGRRGKKKLDQMKILKVLFKTLLVTCRTDEIDEAKFKKRVADWFRQAGGRIKSAEKRQDLRAIQDVGDAVNEVLPIENEANRV